MPTTSHTGQLSRHDLGTGGWCLTTDAGRRYLLQGAVPPALAGQRVRIEGELHEPMGFAMTGDPVLVVAHIAPAG